MSFLAHEENGLLIKTSTVLSDVRHGFSTRIGGVSPAPWDSLNLGVGRGDDMDRVRENYRRFCAALGVDEHRAVLSKQVHENNVRHVTAEDCGKGLFRDRDYTSVDAMVTDTPGIPLVVFSADCGIILLHDPVHEAVGAAHAGWRGAACGIAYKTVRRMQELFGTDPGDLRAAIGAAIGLCCFETDADVPQALEAALGAEAATDTTLQDVAALRMVGVRVVLVHGGGKHITALLDKLQVPTRFENGYRYTDQAVLETAEMALSAQVNKAIVSRLSQLEVSAVGLSGKDGGLLTAVEKDPALGRVGSITRVEPRILQTLLDGDFLPVVSPIAAGEDGGGFNCNADDAARAVAAALGADKLIFLTDTAGVLIDSHNSKTAVPHMDVKRAEELIDTGLIAGGMVPKVRGCIQAIRAGVGEVSILDGRVEHALLLEMLNQRVQGTTITG